MATQLYVQQLIKNNKKEKQLSSALLALLGGESSRLPAKKNSNVENLFMW